MTRRILEKQPEKKPNQTSSSGTTSITNVGGASGDNKRTSSCGCWSG